MTTRSLADALRPAALAGLCAITLASTTSAYAACGDTNSDGKISAGDALYTLRASVESW